MALSKRCHTFRDWMPRACPNGTRLRTAEAIFRHGGACPRRAMFTTRNAGQRRLHATTELASVGRCSRENAWETPLHAGKPRGGETQELRPRSGFEHSSTEASSVVGGGKQPAPKSGSEFLTSCHSGLPRWIQASALLPPAPAHPNFLPLRLPLRLPLPRPC